MKWGLFFCMFFVIVQSICFQYTHSQTRYDIPITRDRERSILNHNKINTVLTSLHALFVSVELFVHAISEIIDGIYILYHFFVHSTGQPESKKITKSFIMYVLAHQMVFLKAHNNIIRSTLVNELNNISYS